MKHEKLAQLLLIFIPIAVLFILLAIFIYFNLFSYLVDLAHTLQRQSLLNTTEQTDINVWRSIIILISLAAVFLALSVLFDFWAWRKKLASPCPICGKARPDRQENTFVDYLKRRHDQKCRCFPSVPVAHQAHHGFIGHWRPK